MWWLRDSVCVSVCPDSAEKGWRGYAAVALRSRYWLSNSWASWFEATFCWAAAHSFDCSSVFGCCALAHQKEWKWQTVLPELQRWENRNK